MNDKVEVRKHIYRDEAGQPIYRKTIRKFPDGDKDPTWEHFKEGKWHPGVGPKDTEGKPQWVYNKRLYNLPGLFKIKDKTDVDIWIVEGEKCADALIKLGLTATTHCVGSKGKWREVYGTYMKNHVVNIIGDEDENGDGEKYAKEMAQGALRDAKEVRVVKLPNIPNKPKGYDVADWIDRQPRGNPNWLVRKLKAFAEEATPCTKQNLLRYKLYTIEDIKNFKPLPPIIPNLILDKAFNQLIGKPKATKTTHSLSQMFAIQTGRSWLGHHTQQKHCAYITAEPESTVLPKILAVEKNIGPKLTPEQEKLWSEAIWIFDQPLLNTKDIEDVIKTLKAAPKPIGLVFIDPLQDTISGSENSSEDMSAYTHAIRSRIMGELDCAVQLLHHTPRSDDNRARGSLVLLGSVDHEVILQRPKNVKGEGPAKLECGESRVSGTFDTIYTYLEEIKVKEGDITITAPQIRLSDSKEYEEKSIEEDSKDMKKYEVLFELSEKSKDKGWVDAKDWVEASGVSRGTLRTTAKKLVEKGYIEEEGSDKGGKKRYRPVPDTDNW